jgi:hypothetical protein
MKGLLLGVSAVVLAVQVSAGPIPSPPYTIDFPQIGPIILSDGTTFPRFAFSFNFLQALTTGNVPFTNGADFSGISAPNETSTGGKLFSFDAATSFFNPSADSLIIEYTSGASTLDINATVNESTFGTLLFGAGSGVSATASDNLKGSFQSDGQVDIEEDITGTSAPPPSVPEPASIALLGVVILFVPVLYRRWKRAAA